MFGACLRKIALSVCVLFGAPLSPADTVVLIGKPAFQNVTVTDVRHGRLIFRGISGETLQKPLGGVERVAIDALPHLAEADDALTAADFDAALATLGECEKSVRENWQRTLVRYRRLAALAAAGRTDQALETFLELVRDDPQTPAENLPHEIGPAGSGANRAALALLRKTRLRGLPPELENALTIRRLELTLLEEPESLSRDFTPVEHVAASVSPTSRASDDEDAPLLFGTPRSAPTAATIALARDSAVRKEAGRLLASGDARQALALLDRALPFVQKSERGWWTLEAARCRIALRDFARAADELLALATSAESADRDLSAQSLYYVGLAHEGLNRPDVAADQYRELRSRNDLPAELRAQVEAALERLKQKQ